MRNCILFAAFAAFVCGCGGGSEGRKPVYPVTGKVTLSGSPVTGATVSYGPNDGQPVAVGKTDDAGVYHLTTYDWQDGAAPGNFNVMITKTAQAPAPTSTHDAMKGGSGAPSHDASTTAGKGAGASMLNEKYSRRDTSGLEAEVKTSDNVFDFDLQP